MYEYRIDHDKQRIIMVATHFLVVFYFKLISVQTIVIDDRS